MDTHSSINLQLRDLTFYDRTNSPLPIHAVTLTLTNQDDSLSECRLTFQISPELYQRIEAQALFNLKPGLRGSLSAGDFQPEPDIQIEATLQPDLLPHLAEHTTNLEAAATYLQNLSQEQPDNPLLSTESWFALHVKQPQESGETGYSTFWAYLNPSVISQDNISSEQITEGMVNFFKDWTDANLSELNQNTISESIEEITKAFEEWTDTTLSETQNAISEALEEVTSAFEELADTLSETTEDATSSKQILEEIIDFFTEDDWPYTKIKGEPVLLTAFQGENGKWNCSAKARVEQEQFVFYSICPINAPENKRLAIAEFLTRANSGMIIGNFELDFTDGEIRYKTSIDFQGDFLSFELIKQLVYANVTMMDEYLPGIKSVIENDVEPKDAIAQIESQPE
ncbi:YbjN domain-containing protein [Microcoleus sp. ZQ-A2]|nr:YbjN domain-containing protein [Microcoleus sp. FACHB-1]